MTAPPQLDKDRFIILVIYYRYVSQKTCVENKHKLSQNKIYRTQYVKVHSVCVRLTYSNPCLGPVRKHYWVVHYT